MGPALRHEMLPCNPMDHVARLRRPPVAYVMLPKKLITRSVRRLAAASS